MKLRNRAPRGAVVMLVALIAALGVAACGSSSKNTSKNASATTTKSGSGKRADLTAFTTCLKQHGVKLPARRAGSGFGGGFGGGTGTGTGTNAAPPTGTTSHGGTASHRRFGGGGFFGGGGAAGGFGANSKFGKAFKACGSKLGSRARFFPGGGSPRGRFPGAGSAGGPGGGRVHFSTAALKSFVACVRKNGYAAMPEPNTSGRFPLSVEKNAKFQAASRKCVSILQTGIHAQGQSTTSTSTSAARA